MKNTTEINLKGAQVTIDWINNPANDILGHASHTVSSDSLDEGTADGPSDGENFEIEGKKFRLGEHDYETDDGKTTCTAAVYAEVE